MLNNTTFNLANMDQAIIIATTTNSSKTLDTNDICHFMLGVVSGKRKFLPPLFGVISFINCVLAPATFFLNFLVVWTILSNDDLKRSCYNCLIALLGLTDLMVGVTLQPLLAAILVHLLLVDRPPSCSLLVTYLASTNVLTIWSVATLTVLSIERYIVIRRPFSYAVVVSKRKMMLVTMLLWILYPVIALACTLPFKNSLVFRIRAVFGTILMMFFVITAYANCSVHLTALRHRRAIAVQTNANENTPTVGQQHREDLNRKQSLEDRNAPTGSQQNTPTVGQQPREALNGKQTDLEDKNTSTTSKQSRKDSNRKQHYFKQRWYTTILSSFVYFMAQIPMVIIFAVLMIGSFDASKMLALLISATTFAHLQSLINPILFMLCLSYLRRGVHNKYSSLWNCMMSPVRKT